MSQDHGVTVPPNRDTRPQSPRLQIVFQEPLIGPWTTIGIFYSMIALLYVVTALQLVYDEQRYTKAGYVDAFNVPLRSRLVVSTAVGDVFVSPGQGRFITVSTALTGIHDIEYAAIQRGDDSVEAVARFKNPTLARTSRASAFVDVRVPESSSVLLRAERGDIEVSRVHGEGTLAAVSGDVRLLGVKGDFVAETGEGDIEATVNGSAKLESGVGDILFVGSLNAGSTSVIKANEGNVVVAFAESDDVELRISSGNGITVAGKAVGPIYEGTGLADADGKGSASLIIEAPTGNVTVSWGE